MITRTSRNLEKFGILFVGLACFAITHIVNAQVLDSNLPKSQAELDASSQKRLLEIQNLVQANDLNGLDKIGSSIASDWESREAKRYFPLMLSLVQEISSHDFGFDRSHRPYWLAKKYANLALKRADEMLPSMRMSFMTALIAPIDMNDDVTVDRASAYEQDLKQISLFLAFLDDSIDKDYDPNLPVNGAYMNLAPQPKKIPPLSQITISGMSPKDIQDPETRSSYEAALKANARKAQKKLTQMNLKNIDAQFSPLAETYVTWLCSQKYLTIEQLDKTLKEAGVNNDRKTRIMDVVAQDKKLVAH